VAVIVPPVFGPSAFASSRTWALPLQPGASLLKRLCLKSKLGCGLSLFTENLIFPCRSTSLMVSSCSFTEATRDVAFCSPLFNF
jgi:hypothetical protein